MYFYFEKGSHFSSPRIPKFFVRRLWGWAAFDEKAVYDIGPEQDDWNKLTGISFNPLKPDKNALMVAWRWNPKLTLFEVAPYINDDSKKIFPLESEILRLKFNQGFRFVVEYEKIVIIREESNIVIRKTAAIKTNYLTSFRIQPYFGGNSVAPRNLSVQMNFY